jgi:glycosyltransferase involved in cell wall biosynthesis
MLSILIPTYNYNITSLVYEVHKQATNAKIDFEIICFDDGSKSEINSKNESINQINHCRFKELSSNIGRSSNRNLLAQEAQYEILLFLDADVMPKSDNFILNYLNYFHTDFEAIYGGFAYKKEKPKDEFMLRWTYGKSKEQVTATLRNKMPYKIVISANFMIKKSVFLKLNPKILKSDYGYDNYFGALLKLQKIKVLHIDNEVFHLGLDSNTLYLNKVHQAIHTLLKLKNKDEFISSQYSLLNTFIDLKKWKLHFFFSWLYKTFKRTFQTNLLGRSPSIFVLQTYKLSYLCYQDLNT